MPHSFDNALRALDRAAARWVDAAIAGYQRWLSPLKGKGRGCAHRLCHGGGSCSQHVRRLLAETGGLVASLPGARARFAACREAASAAAASPLSGIDARYLRARGQCCIVIPCGTTRTIRV